MRKSEKEITRARSKLYALCIAGCAFVELNEYPSRRLTNILAAIFLTCVGTGAIAGDLTIAEYQKFRDSTKIRIYLSGVFQGIHYANSLLATEGKPSLYCPPNNLALNVENVYQMIDANLKSDPGLSKTSPVAGIILLNLENTFRWK